MAAGTRCLLAGGSWRRRNRAELPHQRHDIDDSPGLGDSAIEEARDEDLIVGDGFAGWWDAHEFTPVGPGDHVPADDPVALGDDVFELNVEVGAGPMERGKHQLERRPPGYPRRQR